MKFIHLITISLILIFPSLNFASTSKTFDTQEAGCGCDGYAWIIFMSEGELKWLDESENPKEQGVAYRIVITRSEIYNGVSIEKITLGDEGCCVKVSFCKSLDLNKIYKSFGFTGEITGFKFFKWISHTSFEFFIHEKKFFIQDIDKKQVKITEI